MAEQLYFTWADHGLEGRGMWQIVAATERLFHRLTIARRQARELCTEFVYPPVWRDPATAPTSFGWRDVEGLRYAFRRVHNGVDQFGRPGVFAAHVLIDRPEQLPARQLLAGAASPSWWSGAAIVGDDAWLPAVSIGDFEPGAAIPADDDVTTAVLTAVLAHAGRPVLLSMDSALIVGALQRVTTVLPEVLDDLSVSTYEPRATRANYGLAATTPPDDDPLELHAEVLLADAGVALPRDVARLTLNGDERSRSYVAHSWAARERGPSPRATFLSACRALLVLRDGKDPKPRDLLPGLRSAGTAADLLDRIQAREVIAGALGAGDRPTVEALRGVGPALEQETWTSIGELAARAVATPDGSRTAFRLLDTTTRHGVQAFVAESVRLALTDPALVRHWPEGLIASACRGAALPATGDLRAAVISAGAAHVLWLADNRRMPPDMWAQMLAAALDHGLVDVAAAARALRADGNLARATGATLPASRLKTLLGALHPMEALEPLREWAAPRRCGICVDLARQVARRLPDGEQWRAAAAVAGCVSGTGPGAWPALRNQVIRQRLAHELDNVGAARCDLTAVVRTDAGPDGRAWSDFLRLTGRAPVPGTWPQHARALADAVARLPAPDQALAVRYALYIAASHATIGQDVAEIAHTLAPGLGDDPGETAELVLRGGLRGTVTTRGPEAGVAALFYVALWLVEPSAVRRHKRTGELARQAAQDAAMRLYSAVARRDPRLEGRWQAWIVDRPRAERWLRGLHGWHTVPRHG
ncbi:hypothetical protein ACFO1B_15250 [Dactylosporangium siamense]|uniref:GTPase-associated protein 1 N-terminal domain-containing protein n=1 Tax=Dactylosporangium siamense TaxID=685454 RepID=A0A919U806_9ACTN|nr:hypothetical protein [Dactylosporangium siamense]GIG45192.1 hypothetical protein Dsi01nite_032330 [Dactylosporangium siamense]